MNAIPSTSAMPTDTRVFFGPGQGGLTRLDIHTRWSQAELYLHGAHVTHFQKHGEPPLLFLSEASRFEAGHPIRGGIPLVFPWFGPRPGLPAHGFARFNAWLLERISFTDAGECQVALRLPRLPEWMAGRPYAAEYVVTVGRELGLELKILNESPHNEFEFEACLHTYFAISDIGQVKLTGLHGATYRDALQENAVKSEKAESITIGAEVDRLYQDTSTTVTIHDPGFKRRITVEKSGSQSTVVWNPWIAKAKRMPDFGDEEYQKMVCVESGIITPNEGRLAPNSSHTLAVKLGSAPL